MNHGFALAATQLGSRRLSTTRRVVGSKTKLVNSIVEITHLRETLSFHRANESTFRPEQSLSTHLVERLRHA